MGESLSLNANGGCCPYPVGDTDPGSFACLGSSGGRHHGRRAGPGLLRTAAAEATVLDTELSHDHSDRGVGSIG